MIVVENKSSYKNITKGSIILSINGKHPSIGLFEESDQLNISYFQKRGYRYYKTSINIKKPTIHKDNNSPVVYTVMKNGIYYMRIPDFTKPIQNCISSGILYGRRTLIIDLRDNFVGKISNLINFASYFVENGLPLFYLKSKDTVFQVNTIETAYKVSSEIHIYIFVNENTYSCAELLCEILRAHRKATVLGELTAGKRFVLISSTMANLLTYSIPKYIFSLDACVFDTTKRIAPDYYISNATLSRYVLYNTE